MEGKVVVKRYPVDGPIVVAGMVFENVKAIAALESIMVRASKASDARMGWPVTFQCREEPVSRDGWCNARIYEPYPCFDAEDYANESRCFNNYVFHRGSISPELCKEFLKRIPRRSDYNLATENAPCEFLPIVYHDDGADYVLVAEWSGGAECI